MTFILGLVGGVCLWRSPMLRNGELIFAIAIVDISTARLQSFTRLRRRCGIFFMTVASPYKHYDARNRVLPECFRIIQWGCDITVSLSSAPDLSVVRLARSCCLDPRGVDVRQTTSSAFIGITIGQVPKSRGCSSEPHSFRAAWAKRRLWRVFIRVFVTHDRSGP